VLTSVFAQCSSDGYTKNQLRQLAQQLVPDIPNELFDTMFSFQADSRNICTHEIVEWAVGGYADLKATKPHQLPCPADRGITLEQLQKLMRHVESRCETEQWISTEKNKPRLLKPDDINLYDLMHYVVSPATRADRCCYVEYIAKEPQRADVFVSHWWGEAVSDFTTCVARHQKVRGLPENAAYWVCAYGNNQHDLDIVLGSDPMYSPFCIAMKHAVGVLLVLDEKATPFTRIWCCFEEGMVVTNMQKQREVPLLLDIATVDNCRECHLLVEGLTADEQAKENDRAGKGWKMKSLRESRFPLRTVKPALQIDICTADSSQPIDKQRILSALARFHGEALDGQATDPQQEYKKINQTLRGIFAVAAWRQAVEKEEDISSPHSYLPLARILKEDTERKVLELVFDRVEVMTHNHLTTLCNSLPGGLRAIKLTFTGCLRLTSTGTLGKAIGQCSNLSKLDLSFNSCKHLVCVDELGIGLGQCCNLTDVTMWFNFCTSLSSVHVIGNGLSQCRNLTNVTLRFDYCAGLSSVDEIGNGLGQCCNLKRVKLSFFGCIGLTSVDKLGKALGYCCRLTHIDLTLSHCTGITSVDEIGKGLGQCHELTDVTMYLDGCTGINSVDEIGKGLGTCCNLVKIDLSFFGCDGLLSVDELGKCLGRFGGLAHICSSFSYCTNLTSVEEVGKGLGQCHDLTDAELYFIGCTGISSVAAIVQGLNQCQALSKVAIHLGGCSHKVVRDKLRKSVGQCQDMTMFV